jgi:hypothetical protein
MNCSETTAAALLSVALALHGAPVQAALGEPASAVAVEAQSMGALHHRAAAPSVHQLQWSDGSQVRQYANASGIVYAVTWATRGKPQLPLLLGRHFSRYASAARGAMLERPGVRHGGAWGDGDLVVEQHANADAFVGRAYLRSMIPAGQDPDAIR